MGAKRLEPKATTGAGGVAHALHALTRMKATRLRHPAEVTAYLATRARQRATVRAENERRSVPTGIRARRLAGRIPAAGKG